MEETQMTDSELIKALENSINTYNEKGVYVDTENIQQQVLDLLKRQKTEIERLKSMNQAKLDCIHDLQKENEILSRNADTAFQDGLNERRDLFAPEIKAEAIKEFAERLKEKSFKTIRNYGLTKDVVEVCDIDNLVKEMVGDKE